MRTSLNFGFFILNFLILTGCQNNPKEVTRTRENFGHDWKFLKDAKSETETAVWENVNLPHTMNIEPLVVNDQYQGTSKYEKSFAVDDTTGKKFFLYFEGVMHLSRIKLNGVEVGSHSGGYLPFTVDLTNHLNPNSTNLIEVWVNNEDNPQIPPGKSLETLDFNYYGGIYRNVYLITTGNIYITDPVEVGKAASGGLLVHFYKVNKESAEGILQVHLRNESAVQSSVSFIAILLAEDGKEIRFTSPSVNLGAGEEKEIRQNILVANPELWSPETPHLYKLEVQLLADEKPIDMVSTKTGIRKIELTENGFYLNGEKQYIRGTNRHQEYPYIGYALSDEAQWRDAVNIKNAGFDFVRLSHYPHAEAFMDACDELGLMVMNCIPGWQFFGDSVFVENSYQNCRDLIRRDRNHPGVIFWELSLNESSMTDEYMETVNEILDQELPFADAYSAGWIDHESYDLFIPARQHATPPEYWNNYKSGNRNIFVAEYGDWEYYAQNAGFDQKAFGDLKEEERSSRQLRVDGEKRLLQQAFNFQEAANSNRQGNSIIGDANWLMHDYNRGYADDLEASGISDIFRIPKFAYYFYQSQRPPEETLEQPLQSGPMVHIASYWNKNSSTRLTVYSNCEEVELSLNGKTINRKKAVLDRYASNLKYPPFVFDLETFKPGTLIAKGFIDGTEVARHEVTTPGNATQIILEADLSVIPINENLPDVIFVYARICDTNGTIAPDASPMVIFRVEGNGNLIGENPVQAEAGIATILLRTENFTSPVIITAESAGLQTGNIRLKPKIN